MKGNVARERKAPFSFQTPRGFSFETRHGETSQSGPIMADKVICGKTGTNNGDAALLA
jgi:hypothetical protein